MLRIRRKEGNSHISLRTIQQYLLHGAYPNASTTLDKRSIRKRAESFKIDDGDELYYIVRPKRLDDEPPDPDPGANRLNYRKAVFTPREHLALTAHLHVNPKGTHMGTERTLHALTSKYYWVGMSTTVRKILKSCAVCLANRPAFASQIQASPGCIDASLHRKSQEHLASNVDVSMTETRETSNEDLPYIIKTEVENPQDNDSDFDFDNSLLYKGDDLISASQMLHAQRFWERVELLILDLPQQSHGKKMCHLLVAVDSFSKWPEAIKMETVNEKIISQFVIQLVSRYGVMEQLVFMENKALHDAAVVCNVVSENLNMFKIAVSSEMHNPYDDSWKRISKSLNQFVRQYPESWCNCLDMCLMSLRMSVSSRADYSPAYLLMNRDPKFPSSVLPERDSSQRELMLTQSQLKTATDRLMSGFMECSALDVKRVAGCPVYVNSTVGDTVDKEQTSSIRRSTRKSKKFHRLAGFDNESGLKHSRELSESQLLDSDDSDENSAVSTQKWRKLTTDSRGESAVPDVMPVKSEVPRGRKETKATVIDNEETYDEKVIYGKVGTDLFYLIIKNFLESATFPANSPLAFQQAVRLLSESYSLVDGELVFNNEQGRRTVATTLKERWDILNKIHCPKAGSGSTHVAKAKMLEEFEKRLVSWKDIISDVDAFVKACPLCKLGWPVKRKSRKRNKRWRKDQDDDTEDDVPSDDESSEAEDVGKASYPELIAYLKKDIYPEHLTRAELVIFKKKAKSFKLIKGDLHYFPVASTKATPKRRVLLSEDERLKVMNQAHGAEHLVKAATIAELRKHYFWHAMGQDVERFIESCCQLKAKKFKDIVEKHIYNKFMQFRNYFQGNVELDNVQPEALDVLFQQGDASDLSKPVADDVISLSSGPEVICHQLVTPAGGPVVVNEVPISLDEHTGLLLQEHDLSNSGGDERKKDDGNEEGDNDATNQKEAIGLETNSAESGKRNHTYWNQVEEQVGATSIHDINDGRGDIGNAEGNEKNLGIEVLVGKVVDLKPPVGLDIKAVEEIDEPFIHEVELFKIPKKKGVKIRCEHCRIIVRGENNYKEHQYKHTGIKPFQCNLCPKMFTSVKGLRLHMRKHTGHRPYLCNICGRGFPRSASLRYHIKTHDKSSSAPIICDVCDRKFTTDHRLRKHKRFKHPDEAPVYKCDQCGKQFTAKRSLKRHQEAHQGIRRYECPHCKRSFFRKEYLNYHLESHFKDNPLSGPLTAKRRFKKRALMQQQQQQQQQGEKEAVLSIVSLDQSTGQESVFPHLVEVTNPQGWTEIEHQAQEGQTMPAVISLDGSIRLGDINNGNESGHTVVMMEEQPSASGGAVQLHHIIVPSSHIQQQQQQQPHQQTQQQQQLQHHYELQPQQQEMKHAVLTDTSSSDPNQPRMIEVTLSNGQQHTLTLAGAETLHISESGQETVQYHVECLPGESLTEADFQAIQMLAQASVLQQP